MGAVIEDKKQLPDGGESPRLVSPEPLHHFMTIAIFTPIELSYAFDYAWTGFHLPSRSVSGPFRQQSEWRSQPESPASPECSSPERYTSPFGAILSIIAFRNPAAKPVTTDTARLVEQKWCIKRL